jgi:glycosyltransferase involved in cell wall biosynthesis
VVVIFLDAEAFLAEAVDSVLAQTFTDWELLLVDDGSHDASSAIALNYAASHPGKIRYCEHAKHANLGMSASRNLGIRHARGEFIAFIDADDVWLAPKLADQLAIMDAHPGLAMVSGAVLYWRSWCGGQDQTFRTGHVGDRIIFPPEAALRLYPLGKAISACPSDVLVRREAGEHVGWFEEHFTGPRQMYEDLGFFTKLLLASPVYFSTETWLKYRQHPDSCSAMVRRTGRYNEVRHYFLTWLESYLANRSGIDARIGVALRRALRPYRHPRIHFLVTRLEGARWRLGAWIRRSG